MSIIKPVQKATSPQVRYIEILCVDLNFNRATRNAFISDLVGREIHYADELTKEEASLVIEQMKETKDCK